MNRTRIAHVVGSAVLGLSAIAACGTDETPAAQDDTSEPAPVESASDVALATADVGELGEIVVNGDGRTVYLFTKDTADPPKSNCSGDCAAMWPPVEAGTGTPKIEGIDDSLVGSVTRDDGTEQLTISGWPLYLFAKDAKAGEAKGQAVGDAWWVVGADGTKITTKAAVTSGGY